MGNHRNSNVKPSSTRKGSSHPSNPKQVHDLPAGNQAYGTVASSSTAAFQGQREPSIGLDYRFGHRQAYAPASGSSDWHHTPSDACSDNSADSWQGSGVPSQDPAAASEGEERRVDRQNKTSRAQAMMDYVPQFPQGPVVRESWKVIEEVHALHPTLVPMTAPQPRTNGGMMDEFAQLEAEERSRETNKYANRY